MCRVDSSYICIAWWVKVRCVSCWTVYEVCWYDWWGTDNAPGKCAPIQNPLKNQVKNVRCCCCCFCYVFFSFSAVLLIYSSTINSLHEPYAELTIHFSMRTEIDVEKSNQKRLNGGRTSREYISIREESANLIRAERCLCIRRTCFKRKIKKIRRSPNRHIWAILSDIITQILPFFTANNAQTPTYKFKKKKYASNKYNKRSSQNTDIKPLFVYAA